MKEDKHTSWPQNREVKFFIVIEEQNSKIYSIKKISWQPLKDAEVLYIWYFDDKK